MKKYNFLIALSILYCCTGCLSLKEVNQYASVSVASLNKINEVNYSFTDYCSRDCELRQMRNGEIDTMYNCQCTPVALQADSTIQKIHHTVTAYLQALEQLSNNQNFKYDVSGLAGALQQNRYTQLTDQQTSVITKAGNVLATLLTAGYRKHQIKKYLEQTDAPFADLMETFITITDSRLRLQLRNDYSEHFTNEKQMLHDTTTSKGLKQFVVKQFIDERAYYTRHVALLDCYVALLRKVKEGHHQVYLQRDHLNDKNLKDLAMRYAADVQDIAASVKQ